MDAALILEAGFIDFFNSILLITAKKSIRFNRILLRGNIPKEQIKKRMDLQMPESQKKNLVSITIENNSDVQVFYTKLEHFWVNLIS